MTGKPDIDVSVIMEKALSDLERVELEFSIEKPQAEASAEKIEGRFLLYLREKGDTPN